MLYVAFASNFLWVMVIGLIGPSVPAIVENLGINYAQAGLFFTFLSIGSLFGTSLGALASDYLNRKLIYSIFAGILSIGLIAMGFASSYVAILLTILIFSLFGSPIGAIGQSIMLDLYPDNRDENLALQTFFAALGIFVAPLIVSLNSSFNFSWRWSFIQAGLMAALLLIAVLTIKIAPARVSDPGRKKVSEILKNTTVLMSALLVFLSVSIDLGFSYWLAEYFKSELNVDYKLASASVSIFVLGIVIGRILVSRLVRVMNAKTILLFGLGFSFIMLILFINIDSVASKMVLCFFYGLGIGPVFPLSMALGTRAYPKQPGVVTGVLFACLSLGGMVFPFFIGILASHFTIGRAYYFNLAVILGILITLILKFGVPKIKAHA